MATKETTLLSIKNLNMVYQAQSMPVEALQDINLDIKEQEFVSIVGPSGCGKSTLLLLIAGLLKATNGSIVFNGRLVEGALTDIGIVFQDSVLLEWRNALNNVLLQGEVRGLDKSYINRAKELFSTVGLAGFEDKYPWELSGGMRQRVSICRALLHKPSLLLMDEPFGALDAFTRDSLRLELLRLWDVERKTVIFITHDISEAVFLSSKVIVFSSRPGRVVAERNIRLPYPRGPKLYHTQEFYDYVQDVRQIFEDEGILQGSEDNDK